MKRVLLHCALRVMLGVLLVPVAHAHEHGDSTNEVLRVTPAEMEKMFLMNNLQLLAERFNVGIADAQIAQAKVWDNPEISVSDFNFWAPSKYREDLSGPLTFSAELSQVIKTAGKRSKLVAMRKTSKEMAIKQFEDLLRGLKAELRKAVQEIVYFEAYRKVLDTQEKTLASLIGVYERQVEKGNLPRGELIRLQAALFEIEGEINGMAGEQCEKEMALNVLLSLPPETTLEITFSESVFPELCDCELPGLLATMLAHRPDVNLSEKQIAFFAKSVVYEKAQRYPDVTVGMAYNRVDGYWPRNFVGFGISVPLPIFDRNKGGIKEAQLSHTQSILLAEQQKRVAGNEVAHALHCYCRARAFYEKTESNPLVKDLDAMMDVYSKNLLSRNISIVEYMDFMDVYKSTRQGVLNARKGMALEFEELQFAVGIDIKRMDKEEK